MEVLVNELSLHGQFDNVQDFQKAIQTLAVTRKTLSLYKRKLHCHRNLLDAQITRTLTLRQAIRSFTSNERRLVMSWLTRDGPFWEDSRQHSPDEYLEYQNQVVTDTALGEAAHHCSLGREYHTFSFEPSNWRLSPIRVIWYRNNENIVDIQVFNHWKINTLEAALKATTAPIESWQQLASDIPSRCPHLTFTESSFKPLYDHPFVDSAAKRIEELLITLNKFKACFNDQGQRTVEGNRLYQDHFTGCNAWFSDSSDKEKAEFKTKLTFKCSNDTSQTLFCPWHGKVKTRQIRIHFSWPIKANETLYVPYIGPKITKL